MLKKIYIFIYIFLISWFQHRCLNINKLYTIIFDLFWFILLYLFRNKFYKTYIFYFIFYWKLYLDIGSFIIIFCLSFELNNIYFQLPGIVYKGTATHAMCILNASSVLHVHMLLNKQGVAATDVSVITRSGKHDFIWKIKWSISIKYFILN